MDIWVVVEARTPSVVIGSYTTWQRAMHAKEIRERNGYTCFIYFTEVNSENVRIVDSEEISSGVLIKPEIIKDSEV